VIIGDDVRIHPNCEFTRPDFVEIEDHVAIDYGFYCTTRLLVGDYVHIASHVSVIGGAEGLLVVDHFGFISTGSRIICGSDNMLGDGIVGPFIPEEYADSKTIQRVKIEMFAGLGCNSVMLPGSTLSEGAILGANSLLKGYAEPWTIYVGSPARPVAERRSGKILGYAKEMGYV
jgi:acetyltransferase-like isoleucine patch superfamily enzyme